MTETTPNHPFLTVDGEWVAAADLEAGDEVVQPDGMPGTVESVVTIRSPQSMYNLTVAVAHTYVVGDGQSVVHNAKCAVPDGFKRVKRSGYGIQQLSNDSDTEIYAIDATEKPFLIALMDRKPNYEVYRSNQHGSTLMGDFVIVDRTNPKKVVGWIVDHKTSGGLAIN